MQNSDQKSSVTLEDELINLHTNYIYKCLEKRAEENKNAEVFMCITEEDKDYLLEFCSLFEKKFGKKLLYRFDDICYVRYAE